MATVKILVVEDEMIIANNICMILEDLGYQVLEPAINYAEALETIERDEPDLALLDIQLIGKKDGVDLAEQINSKYHFPFIFLTSNSDAKTIERVKNVNPHAFLVKPFKKEDIYTSIELALHNYSSNKKEQKVIDDDLLIKDAIFIKENHLFHKIKLCDIRYFKSDRIYVELFTTDGKKHFFRGSLSDLSERLPKNFFRSHRSFIINVDYMDAINSSYVLIGDEKIPIGRNYRDHLLSRIRVE
ncbi:MAG: response regulator [Cyclobacteriaceae bacterium]